LEESPELGVVVMEVQSVLTEADVGVMPAHRVLLFKVNIAFSSSAKADVGLVAEGYDMVDDFHVVRSPP
jgi:hypothetical protein